DYYCCSYTTRRILLF
nr:immunoglobulin light chain junction region [Macaca mulatta]